MDNSTYFALASQITTFNNLNVVANNVANGNTTGFKKDDIVFTKFLTQDVRDKNSFPNDYATTIDQSPGAIKATNRALDVAINSPGFFMVQTPLGIRYTKKGDFLINQENQLATPEGYLVLSAGGQPIAFEPQDPAPTIDKNGNIIVGEDNRGNIGVVSFADLRLLRKSDAGDGLLISEVNGEIMENPNLLQGSLEQSNVNAIYESNKLIELQRQAAINSNLISDNYKMQQKAFSAFSK